MRSSCRSTPIAFAFCALLALPSPARALAMLVSDIAGNGPVCDVSCGIEPNDTVAIAVLADGVPAGSDGRGLFGFGFRLSFHPTRLSASNPQVDAQWTGFTDTQLVPGEVGMTGNLFDVGGGNSGPSGDGIPLGTFDLQVLQKGTYQLTLAPFVTTGDNVLFDATVLDDPATNPGFYTTGLLRVIPEPSAAALALAAGAALRARRRSA